MSAVFVKTGFCLILVPGIGGAENGTVAVKDSTKHRPFICALGRGGTRNVGTQLDPIFTGSSVAVAYHGLRPVA